MADTVDASHCVQTKRRSTRIFCVAPGCSNSFYSKKDIHFHRLPLKNPALLKSWIAAMKRADPPITEHSRVCSDHFTEDNYVQKKKFDTTGRLIDFKTNFLKPDTVPSVFDFSQYNMGTTDCPTCSKRQQKSERHLGAQKRLASKTQKEGEQPKQCKKLEHETGCNDYLCKSSSEEVVEPRGNHFSDKKAKNQPVYSEREIQVEHSYCRESTCFTEPFTEIYVQDKAVKTNKRMKPEFTEEFSEDPLCVENPETDTLFKSNNVFECAECNRIYMWNSNFKGLLYNKQVISFNCVECGSELRKEICRPWEDKSINEEKDNSDDHVGKWVDLSDKIKKEKDDYWTEEENMIKGKDWTADCIIKEEEIKQEFVNEEEIF